MSVVIHTDVLPASLCNELYEDTLKTLKEPKDQWCSNFMWAQGIVKASHSVLVRSYPENIKQLILNNLIRKGFISHSKYCVMNYAWTRLSYIPWHNDDGYADAITIYLNPVWDKDWGGYFLYLADEPGYVKGYIPTFNTAVFNKANAPHCTTPVSLDAPVVRATVQIFPIKQ